MLFFMFAAATAVGWGIFGKPLCTAAAILMWGTGDAAAALIGIPFGKHKIRLRFTDGKKSWEGTAAMFLVSLICGLAVFLLYCHFPFMKSLLPIFTGAIVGAITEACSPSEYDTVTVPAAILAVLLLLSA